MKHLFDPVVTLKTSMEIYILTIYLLYNIDVNSSSRNNSVTTAFNVRTDSRLTHRENITGCVAYVCSLYSYTVQGVNLEYFIIFRQIFFMFVILWNLTFQ